MFDLYLPRLIVGQVPLSLGRVPSASQVILSIVVRPTKTGSITNSCTVRASNEGDGFLANNEQVVVTQVVRSTPQLAIERMPSGLTRITIEGPDGLACILQATSDWKGWTNLTTLSLTNGKTSFDDAQLPPSGRRYYRAQLVP
jgi:hypothetical protein